MFNITNNGAIANLGDVFTKKEKVAVFDNLLPQQLKRKNIYNIIFYHDAKIWKSQAISISECNYIPLFKPKITYDTLDCIKIYSIMIFLTFNHS